MTTEQQNRLGDSLYQQMKESGQLNSDPLVNHYINNLGQRLLAAGPHRSQKFTFFVVDNPQINAFAMFGGYIGIYSGLIRAAETESELASVIAHEIAHITQDHLRRAIEKSNKMGIPVTVALLAAILLGAEAPQLAEATVAAVIAGQQQQQLSFSRNHEQEADRIGIELLSSANFNPEAMVDFFSLIQEQGRYGATYPEFLRTHPVTIERISEAQNRARQLPRVEVSSSIDFLAIQARLTLSEEINSEQLISNLNGLKDIKSRYALALALMENQQYKRALEIIQTLRRESPDALAFQMSEAEIYKAMKRWRQAEICYSAILNISPYNRFVISALVELHLLSGADEKGKELLMKLSQYSPLQASELRLLAKISNARGDKAETHLNLGEAFLLEHRYIQALEEFLLAQKYSSNSFYLNNRIDAHIEDIRQIITAKEGKKGAP